MYGVFEEGKIVQCLKPVSATSTATCTGTGVDRLGYGRAIMVLSIGASLTALSGSNYWTFTFEESDVLASGYTTIATGDLDGGLLGTFKADDPTED